MRITIEGVTSTSNIGISKSGNKLTVDVSNLEVDIRDEYEKEEVLEVFGKLAKRNPEVEGQVGRIKMINFFGNEVTVLVMTEEGSVFVYKRSFKKLNDREMSRNAKLTYGTNLETREVWKGISVEARAEKFEKIPDAWDEYLEQKKTEADRLLKEQMEK